MGRQVTTVDSPRIPQGRREANKLDKRRRIIAAARALLHERGFEATTTQEVAKRAGVGAGTLFLYVQTKEDLLILAFVEEMAEVTERAYGRLDRSLPVQDQIADFMVSMLAYHAADPSLTKNLLREVAVLRNLDLLANVRSLPIRRLLSAIVEGGQASGALRQDTNAQDIAALMFALYWDCLRDWVNGSLPEADFRTRLRNMIMLIMGGVGPGEGRGRKAKGGASPPRRKLKRTVLF